MTLKVATILDDLSWHCFRGIRNVYIGSKG